MSMTQKIAKIKKGMEEYEKKRSQPGRRKPKEIVEQCLNPILPTYWDVFHERNISRRQDGYLLSRENDNNFLPCYDVGIFLVGFSSLPIVLSLAEIKPTKEIYFLYSKDTKNKCYEIADRMRAMLNGHSCFNDLINRVDEIVLDIQGCKNSRGFGLEVDDPSDPVKTFKLIKTVIDRNGDKRIALDLTGGKKTMIGGGFTAGAIWASKWSEAAREFADFCDMFYIDSLKYDPDRSAPVSGHEFLSILKNPYDVYNVQSVQQAKKLFEKHNYEAAADLWKSVSENLKLHADQYGLEKEQREVEKDLNMANCYRFWDAFDYEEAHRHKGLWQYNKRHKHDSLDVLKRLKEVKNRQTLFENNGRVIHYAVDHYQSAVRRQASGKLDDAIVRFTQVIEMLCIYRICQIAATSNLVDIANNQYLHENWCRNEHWGIKALVNFLFGEDSRYDSQYKIEDCTLFLQESDYDKVSRITGLIEPRNKFIHFTRRVNRTATEQSAQKLRQLARKFLKNLSRDYRCAKGLSFDELLKLHEFCQLE